VKKDVNEFQDEAWPSFLFEYYKRNGLDEYDTNFVTRDLDSI